LELLRLSLFPPEIIEDAISAISTHPSPAKRPPQLVAISTSDPFHFPQQTTNLQFHTRTPYLAVSRIDSSILFHKRIEEGGFCCSCKGIAPEKRR
jgi:hypothetical protein